MTYIDGFVIAVPTAKKDAFIAHAEKADSLFIEHGAIRVVECWGADLPPGKVTDFQRSVAAEDGETVAFSWVEWPNKATRDTVMAKMNTPGFSDPRIDRATNPMPFDGKRMIFGGFEPMVTHGERAPGDYVQGFIMPVPHARREDYRKMADEAWEMFRNYGATSVVEAWGDDVPEGKVTDFHRAIAAEPGDNVVFSWMSWPSREVCDAAGEKMQSDDAMKMPDDLPFNPQRMVFGGFDPVVDMGAEQ